MLKKLLVVLLSFFLAACSVSQATFIPPENAVPVPTPSSTSQPLSISIDVPSVVPSQPAIDPNFFRDDFTGSLGPQWSWIREDPQNWSLTTAPGFLQINVAGGYVVANTNSNLLLRPAPAGDFQIETELSFNPGDNYQFAGLIVYESNKNFIQVGRGYCRSYECVGRGLYMNYYERGVAVKPNFGQTYRDAGPILLRLSRQGTTYIFAASTDGKVWFIVGSHTSDIKPVKIGLVTGQRVKGNALPAVFDYFEVRSLP